METSNPFMLFLAFFMRPETLATLVSFVLPLLFDYVFKWIAGPDGLSADAKRGIAFVLTAIVAVVVFTLTAHYAPDLSGDLTLEQFVIAVWGVVAGQLAHPVWTLLGLTRLDKDA